MAGFFPSVPMQVNFDLQFIGVRGQWRLLGIAVDVVSATPLRQLPKHRVQARQLPVAPSSESPSPAPTESSTPTAPSVDVGKPKPKPTEPKSRSTLASPRS
jgi:hypothetical protein